MTAGIDIRQDLPVSARQALEAKLTGDLSLPGRSGFPALEEQLAPLYVAPSEPAWRMSTA